MTKGRAGAQGAFDAAHLRRVQTALATVDYRALEVSPP